jgi:hypothetical protein
MCPDVDIDKKTIDTEVNHSFNLTGSNLVPFRTINCKDHESTHGKSNTENHI